MRVFALLEPRWLAAPATVAVLVGALLAAGVAHAGSPAQASALAFSSCMRTHGVPNWPDPNSSGAFPPSTKELATSNPRFPAAQHACQHLLPNSGPPSQAEMQLMRAQALAFSQCVRAHGVSSFPDPDSTGRIPDPATFGISQASPLFQRANQACARYRPPYIPSNAAYDAWARSQGS